MSTAFIYRPSASWCKMRWGFTFRSGSNGSEEVFISRVERAQSAAVANAGFSTLWPAKLCLWEEKREWIELSR